MSEGDAKAINQLREEAIAAANAGDLARMMTVWLDDAVRMAPNEPAAVGKAAIEAQYRALFNEFTLELCAQAQRVEVAGDWAWSWWTYVGAFIRKAGGEAIRETGKCVDILQKQPDGVWPHSLWWTGASGRGALPLMVMAGCRPAGERSRGHWFRQYVTPCST